MTTEEITNANFDICLEKTLKIEGGYVNDPADAGKATKYGVSLKFLQKLAATDSNGFAYADIDKDGDVDEADIQHLTLEDVHRIMKAYFWDVLPMDKFTYNINLQWKLFDISVHASPAQAVRTLQRAVKVEPDGEIGEITLAAVHAMNQDTLLVKISHEQLKYYNKCVWLRPVNVKFLQNWTWRADQQL
jgi:lysozyme family protein